MDPVATNDLPRLSLRGEGDDSVRWSGAIVSYGGHGATQSTTIVFEIEPGGRLGWHTDQAEETQYIVAGNGELRRNDGTFPVGPGSVFVLPSNVVTTSSTPAPTRCGRSPSSHRRRSPNTSTG